MKQRMRGLRVCAILLAATLWGSAYGQHAGDPGAGGDADATAGPGDAADTREQARSMQLTPIPPAYVPFGTALRERLVAARDHLRIAVDQKASAVTQGKTAGEIRALDAQIAEWQAEIAAVQSEMDRGDVPGHPVTPKPHRRAVSSTSP